MLHPFNSDLDCGPLIKVGGVLRLTGGGKVLWHAQVIGEQGLEEILYYEG